MSSGACFLKHFILWRVIDYIVIIVLAIVAAVLGHFVRPHCREFSWTDPTISHPHRPDTFPTYSVVLAVIFVAIVAYVPGELLTRWYRVAGRMNMGLHLNGWVLAHVYSILLAFAIVNLSKLYAGRLRPDFIARLELEGINATSFASFTHEQICDAAREGRVSFPSGHAGTIFAGFVPPSLYLLGLMRTFKHTTYWRACVAFLPLILPIAVAVSRTVDYHHNFDDVLTGALVGTACGVFSVVLTFRPSRTGEWTLRQHPVDTARNKGEDPSDGEEVEMTRERAACAPSLTPTSPPLSLHSPKQRDALSGSAQVQVREYPTE